MKIWARLLLILAGLLPLLIYAASLRIAFLGGMASREAGFVGGWPAGILVPGAAVAFAFLMAASRETRVRPISSTTVENPLDRTREVLDRSEDSGTALSATGPSEKISDRPKDSGTA